MYTYSVWIKIHALFITVTFWTTNFKKLSNHENFPILNK